MHEWRRRRQPMEIRVAIAHISRHQREAVSATRTDMVCIIISGCKCVQMQMQT